MPNIALMELLTRGIERASFLDPVADVVQPLVQRATAPAKDLLSGTAVGHPSHPALVVAPIGAAVCSAVLDLTGGDRDASRRLLGVGIISALPTAATGLSDWSDTSGAERRVGLVHAWANVAGLGLMIASWAARRGTARDRSAPGRLGPRGALLSLTGLGIMGFSGWLGGHLAYALGVGVDTTAFTTVPTEWTDACEIGDLSEGRPVMARVAGTPVLLVRDRGALLALLDRCSHRGGPLHEGEVRDGCVTCPWHGSTFALTSGSVVRGPATRPQAALQTRVVEGRVQVRRDEPRTFRVRPVH
jgi:nitrite reductase/ring-hydroxylating ferredoxin subunit/uncharacterized membrane protein